MSETEQEGERAPGSMEQALIDLFERVGFRPISLEQTGPDGTETIAMLIFHLCPVCAACIPLGSEEEPFPDLHRTYHLEEAQTFDEARVALRALLSMVGVEQNETPL